MRVPAPEATALHPHLGEARRQGRIRVDCHVHTMWSGDSTTTPAELAEAIASAGLDVVCITDHGTIAGALRLADELPCRVVTGQEQRTPQGELIGLFLTERLGSGARSAREVAEQIRAQGGIVYVPHPFDPLRHGLQRAALEELAADGLIDVIEAMNAKTSLGHLNEEAATAARRLGITAGAGSDSHVPDAIGAAFVEVDDFGTSDELLRSLGDGLIVGHHFDSARPWRTRVVPSTSQVSAFARGGPSSGSGGGRAGR
jgi:predicted metal-dependent phosphoesterase TrpH